jgi:hypothetical protein
MPFTENQETIRQVIEEGFNRGNYDALDALYAPDYLPYISRAINRDVPSIRSNRLATSCRVNTTGSRALTVARS